MSTKIWYDKYNIGYDKVDNQWMRSLPLGNGRVAAMVYGNPEVETIEINEESLWSGSQLEEEYDISSEDLSNIRRLLYEGKFYEAEQACKRSLVANPTSVRFFESFGEIKIDYFDKSPVKNYYRDLELSEAIAHVSFDKNDTHVTSETFISARYDVLV
ncbi:MAG: glycoside hydrolase N-terminal domain-containing protein, partial [Clostridia bacterium]|nr:glycoside hydrolase N-terminal domain-containing protein [Clostridia bacterium]